MKRTWFKACLLLACLVCLTAVFAAVPAFAATFTVTYDANGGAATSVPTDATAYNANDTVVVKFVKTDGGSDIPTRLNHEFLGWSEDKDATTPTYVKPTGADDVEFTITKDTTLYAIWKQIALSVIYDQGTGTGMVLKDETAYELNQMVTVKYTAGTSEVMPTKDGYIFTGWKRDYDGKIFSTTTGPNGFLIEKDTTLVAQFAKRCKLTYNANGATAVGDLPALEVYALGTEVTVKFPPQVTATWDRIDTSTGVHYDFLGWGTKATDTVPLYADDKTEKFEISEDITLYAIWMPKQWKVTYDANAGGGGSLPTATTHDDQDENIPVKFYPLPTKSGHTFVGWNTSASGTSGTLYSLDGKTEIAKITADVKLYAQYEKTKYTLTYDLNGGTAGTMPTAAYEADTDVDVVLADGSGYTLPTKAGYKFLGWSANSAATVPEFKTGGTTSFKITKNTTLFAVYELLSFKVVYNANGGSGDVPVDNMDYTPGAVALVKFDKLPTKVDGTFVGWSEVATTSPTATSGIYKASDTPPASVTISQAKPTVTLYAIWEPKTIYTLSYDVNGGIGTAPSNQTGTFYQELTVNFTTPPSKGDGTFVGWDENKDQAPANVTYKKDVLEKFNITKDTKLYAIYNSTDNFTVEYYDANGTQVGVPKDDTKYTRGATVTVQLTPKPPKAGHTFKGWATEQGATKVKYDSSTSSFVITANTKLYPVYEERTTNIMVTYHYNGGKAGSGVGSTLDPKTYAKGAVVSVVLSGTDVLPTKAGYTFVGWDRTSNPTGDPEFMPDKQPKAFTIGAEDVTLYAIYEKVEESLRVTFNVNGGNPTSTLPTPPAVIKSGDKIVISFTNKPMKTGYVFLGWSKDANAETPTYTETGLKEFIITENTTLYAIYGINVDDYYKVVYDLNGGTGTVPTDSTLYVVNETITVKFTPIPTKTDATFIGWATSKTATTPDYADTEEGKKSFKATGTTKEIMLYAIYRATPYSVTYDLNGGMGDVPADAKKYGTDDEVTVLFTPAPTKAGFKFAGWATTAEATAATYTATGTKTFKITANTTLYAYYEAELYNIAYDVNGGTGSVPPSTLAKGGTVYTVQFVPAPTKEGYNFLGWAETKDAKEVKYTAAAVKTFPVTADVTLFAFYELIPTFTVTYDMNGGTSTIKDEKKYVADEEVTVQFTPAPVKEGYEFLGWSDDATETVKYSATGTTTFKIAADTTLTAVYKQVKFKVTYSGSTIVDEKEYVLNDTVTVLFTPEPVKAGYKFLGWADTETATTAKYTATANTFKITADTTLYPVFEQGIYNISYDANGGAGSVPAKTLAYGGTEYEVQFLPAPTKEGYDFVGWAETKDATEAKYAKGGLEKLTVAGDVTLYAIYKLTPVIPVFKVTYDANGGTGSVPTDAKEYKADEDVTVLFDPTPTKKDFVFIGWAYEKDAKEADFTDAGSAEYTFKIKADTTLYAIYVPEPPETFTVTYDANGGTGAVPEDKTAYLADEDVKVLFTPAPTKKDFVFIGWAYDKSAKEPDFADAGSAEYTFKIKADTTLYAVYAAVPKTFKVTYDGNGGTTTIKDAKEYKADETVTVLFTPAPVRENYDFLGWALDKAATTATYTEAGTKTFKITADTTLYAVWEKEEEPPVEFVPVTNVKLAGRTIETNTDFFLKPTVSPATATNQTITWSISPENELDLFAVNAVTGKLRGKTAGKGIIRATIKDGLGEGEDYVKDFTITVKLVNPIKIVLNKKAISLGVGKTFQLFVTVRGTEIKEAIEDESVGEKALLTWSSSDKSIATVTQKGLVKGIAKGKATITVESANGVKATCTVTVKDFPATSLKINKAKLSMKVGATFTLKATVKPANTTSKITWATSAKKIASISKKNGLETVVTALKPGTVTITVKTDNGLEKTCVITIKK